MHTEQTGNPAARPPGDYIRDELASRSWTQADLARILGRPLPTVNEIISGKKGVMPEMAVALASALGGTPESWLDRESRYRLALAGRKGADAVGRRAELFNIAPVKELEKRGWIQTADDPEATAEELRRFFGVPSLDDGLAIAVDFRRSAAEVKVTPAQRAWCVQARRMARIVQAEPYSESNLPACVAELRKLAAYSSETKKAAKVLAAYGIRLVVIEPLQGCKIDAAALWLDEASPVVALSVRFDRVDNFWFNVGHELSHVRHRDAFAVDVAEPGGEGAEAKSPVEKRADRESAETLIPADVLQSFIDRVGPYYSKDRINQFANKVKIHPGVIVGLLQGRGEIKPSANREMLVKVREHVISTALTDGWGQTLDPKVYA